MSSLPSAPSRNRLVLVDIGAAGGVQPKWLPHRDRIRPVLFEPNPAEAAALRPKLARFHDPLVVEHGLADEAGQRTLRLAHWPGCTSVMSPDPKVLAGYNMAALYQTVGTVEVECVRYDELYRSGAVPAPDIIKVDVEGFEHQVLSGFGTLLHDVMGIEAEAWIYPVFEGQKLLNDLAALLAGFDLYLRRIEPVEGFEGDLVCVNAYFTRGKAGRVDLTPAQRANYRLLEKVWQLEPRAGERTLQQKILGKLRSLRGRATSRLTSWRYQ